jgi:hypothetical protein
MTLDTAIADAKAFLGNTKQELEIALAHLRNIIARYEGAADPTPAEALPAPPVDAGQGIESVAGETPAPVEPSVPVSEVGTATAAIPAEAAPAATTPASEATPAA